MKRAANLVAIVFVFFSLQLVAQRGFVTFSPAWTSVESYSVNDLVQIGQVVYRSLAANNLNQSPPLSLGTYWSVFSSTVTTQGSNLQSSFNPVYPCFFGDSRTRSTGASVAANGWDQLVTGLKGWEPEQNFATSGFDQADLFQTIVSSPRFSQVPSSSTCTTNLLWIGVNGGVTQYHEEAAWMADLLWISTPDSTNSTIPVKVPGSMATKVGSGWTTTDHYTSGAKTTVNGDYETGTISARSAVYPIVSYGQNTNFTWCFTIDAQTPACHGPMGGNGTFQSGAPYEYYANSHNLALTYWPYAVREPIYTYVSSGYTTQTNASGPTIPLAAGTHTWKWQCTAGCSNGAYLEGVIGDGVDDTLDGMKTWVLGDFLGTGGGAVAGLQNAASENRIVTQLAHDGFNVAYIPLGDTIDCVANPSDCYDELHPSDSGHRKIANKVVAYTSSLMTPRDRQAILNSDQEDPVTINFFFPNWTGNAIGVVARLFPFSNMRLTNLFASGPNLSSCSTQPFISVVQSGASGSYTLTVPYGNTFYGNSQPISATFFSGMLGPIGMSVGGSAGCTVTTGGNLLITAQFQKY